MENNTEIKTNDTATLFISKTSENFLIETSKWTRFLAILGFIFSGIIIVISLSAGSLLSLIPDTEMDKVPSYFGFMFSIIYSALGILYFFPPYYLFNFSKKLKLALTLKNTESLEQAFGNQKSFFKFFGVLAIIGLCFYGFAAIIALIALMIAV